MLHYMTQDIRRFGLPVHYETEHDEQFNKFIREEILRTNRHNPSKNVAVAFAKQFAIHHVVGVRRVVGVSSGIRQFREDYPEFFSLLFDSRENADNNDYNESPGTILRVNTCGVFLQNAPGGSIWFFGSIKKADRAKYTIQVYTPEQFNYRMAAVFFRGHVSSMFPGYLTTKDNNIVMKPVGNKVEFSREDVELTERLDMHSRFHLVDLGERRVLNVHKYGSLW
ncbi:hypothetical protein CLU79DRAFT_831220 [Phycomyces nitens]|nr:hypothetical protein CLU79DRAFT_831220 [Phycomyces nitens]